MGERVQDGQVGRSGWRRPTAKVVFLAAVLVVLVAYTEMAFEMEWRTTAGRIGPGFFPRIIGGLGILITLISIVISLRSPAAREDVDSDDGPAEEADLGHHPIILVLTVAASVVLVATLTTLGAIVASAIFLFGMLWFLNPNRLATNLILSLALPLGLYLLLQTFLNAGLPSGVLPRF